MKNIRYNVYETNSSSSHSISISANTTGILDTIECNDDGVIFITGKYFGRDWVAYNSPVDKASYCLSDCQYDSDKLMMLMKVIREHTGAKEVILNITPTSNIHYESMGNSDQIFESEESLKNLIFNPESYIFTGSDEETPPPNFFDVGKDIVFTHRLEIEGTDLVFNFCGVPIFVDLENAIESIMDRHPYNRNMFVPNCNDNGKEIAVWEFFPWERHDINENNFSSLTLRNQGIIILYKTENDYDVNGKYIGMKILDSKKLYFKIVEI